MNEADDRVLMAIREEYPDARIDEIRWDREGRVPKYIGGVLSSASSDDTETIARRFVDRAASLNPLPQGNQERFDRPVELPPERPLVKSDRLQHRHVTLQQFVNEVPVFEGSIQVHIDPDGRVVGYKSNRMIRMPQSTSPTVSQDQAVDIALQDLNEPDSEAHPPHADLTLFGRGQDEVSLSWHVELFSDKDVAAYHYFVDAHTEAMLYTFNEMRHVMSRETYTANNQKTIPGQLIISEGDTSHPDPVAWDAHANAGVVHKYYLDHFGRDSYDDSGSVLRSTVHYGDRFNNAFWEPVDKQMVYGDGDGVQFSPLSAATDVVAHELTHAVTSSTARFVYAEESGALDESFADFFGVMVTNGDTVTDWKMGEHIYTPGRVGDALRDISNPPSFGQPDHVDDQLHLQPGEMPQCNLNSPQYNDNGHVHTNSGIPNKAGFLMVAGGTHRAISVEPLGKSVAEQIMYLALTVHLESATRSRWSFRQARLATLDACRQLHPGDSAKLASVMNAWAAVGVGEVASTEGDGGGGKGRCAIATVIYGEDSSQVRRLREFRDHRLATTGTGRASIALYYRTSPGVARILSRSRTLRGMSRVALNTVLRFVAR